MRAGQAYIYVERLSERHSDIIKYIRILLFKDILWCHGHATTSKIFYF